MAASLGAEKLILLTDVEGVPDEKGDLVNIMNDQQALRMIETGVVDGGMFPKGTEIVL